MAIHGDVSISMCRLRWRPTALASVCPLVAVNRSTVPSFQPLICAAVLSTRQWDNGPLPFLQQQRDPTLCRNSQSAPLEGLHKTLNELLCEHGCHVPACFRTLPSLAFHNLHIPYHSQYTTAKALGSNLTMGIATSLAATRHPVNERPSYSTVLVRTLLHHDVLYTSAPFPLQPRLQVQ